MALDLQLDERSAPTTTPGMVTVAASGLRRRANVLFAVALWNAVLWGTRLANLLESSPDYTPGFLIVHSVLFVTSFGLSAVLVVVGLGLRRDAAL